MILQWFRSRRKLHEEIRRLKDERDHAIRVANGRKALADEERVLKDELIANLRDTLHAHQIEKQLQGAISRAELERLTSRRAAK